MARFGFFCLPWLGHVNPLSALAHRLRRRGHETVFFNVADLAEAVRSRGSTFAAFGAETYPQGLMRRDLIKTTGLAGVEAMQACLAISTRYTKALFAEAQPVIEAAELDLWIVDQLDYGAATLAKYMKAPFVTAALTLLRNHEDGVPGYSGEMPSSDPEAMRRDELANRKLLSVGLPFREHLNTYRLQLGLKPFQFDEIWSELAQVSQQPAKFEFLRRNLPSCFHFTGPFIEPSSQPEIPFDWGLLDSRPLMYVSFGTAQGRNEQLWNLTCAAAAPLNLQVLLSTGGASPSEVGPLPGDPLVFPFVPQLQALSRAAVMVTHAGMNSTLECLAAGVPMVAMPIAHDQFGTAARIEWSGAGVRLLNGQRTVEYVRGAISSVLEESGYRRKAEQFSRAINESDGLGKAADIVEQVVNTGEPVLRDS